jgi:hypothetical protein
MDLIIHTQRRILLASLSNGNQPLGELSVSQRNEFPISLQFVEDGANVGDPLVVVPIPAPYTRAVISARPNDNLADADLLFFVDEFTPVGSGQNLRYTGTLDTLTAPIAGLFAGSTTKGRAACLLDIDLLVTSDPGEGRRTIIPQRDLFIYRTIWQGTENVPTTDVPAYPAPSQLLLTSDLGSSVPELRLGITTLTGGGATALDGIATTNLTTPRALFLIRPGEPLACYQLEAGTAAESVPNIIRPDDFHATTNAKIWVRKL